MTTLAAVALIGLPFAAQAAAVDITGGFVRYDGPLVNDPSSSGLHTKFLVPGLGTIVANPTEPIPGYDYAWTMGYGQGGLHFYATGPGSPPPEPVSSVEFYTDRAFDPPAHNAISFAPSTGLDLQVGQRFKLGTFSFTNGSWLGEFPDSQFSFSLHTVSSTPALNGFDLNMTIGFHVTTGCTSDYSVCSSKPVDNADYFYVQPSADYPDVQFSYVGVYEADSGLGNTGSVDLYGRIGSLLPTGFSNPQGGITLQPSIPAVVPEPGNWALMLAGLACMGGIGLWRGRRRDDTA